MPTEATAENIDSLANPSSAVAPLRKLLLADDHHLILDALRSMMSSDFDVLAVDSSQAFLSAVDVFQPDVAILDVNLPGADGFVTAKKVLEHKPNLPIVFLSMYAESSYAEHAAQVGAKAYLPKTKSAQELISAVHAVLDGEVLLHETPARDGASAASSDGLPSRGNELTARQREVLRLIALGSSAKDIANQLNISVRTAEFHRAAIMQRLGLHSTAQMTRYAISNNIA